MSKKYKIAPKSYHVVLHDTVFTDKNQLFNESKDVLQKVKEGFLVEVIVPESTENNSEKKQRGRGKK